MSRTSYVVDEAFKFVLRLSVSQKVACRGKANRRYERC